MAMGADMNATVTGCFRSIVLLFAAAIVLCGTAMRRLRLLPAPTGFRSVRAVEKRNPRGRRCRSEGVSTALIPQRKCGRTEWWPEPMRT